MCFLNLCCDCFWRIREGFSDVVLMVFRVQKFVHDTIGKSGKSIKYNLLYKVYVVTTTCAIRTQHSWNAVMRSHAESYSHEPGKKQTIETRAQTDTGFSLNLRATTKSSQITDSLHDGVSVTPNRKLLWMRDPNDCLLLSPSS